jgi:transporter family protein
VLLLNTLFATLLFLPIILDAELGINLFDGVLSSERGDVGDHLLVALKSFITLSSWLCGYYAIKHLPLTIVGPVNAMRPVVVLIGATLLFGERLNGWQWGGVLITILSLYLLSRSGKRESIDFSKNRYVWALFLAMLLGAVSGLYDKYIISAHALSPLFVQSWFGVYQLVMMTIVAVVLWLPHKGRERFEWRWTIPLITLFVSCADFFYYHALADEEAMIAVVSMIRRSSVIVSFVCGVLLFGERNVRSKVIDLILVLIGMVLLAIGSL